MYAKKDVPRIIQVMRMGKGEAGRLLPVMTMMTMLILMLPAHLPPLACPAWCTPAWPPEHLPPPACRRVQAVFQVGHGAAGGHEGLLRGAEHVQVRRPGWAVPVFV
jgi:hypothetical protein